MQHNVALSRARAVFALLVVSPAFIACSSQSAGAKVKGGFQVFAPDMSARAIIVLGSIGPDGRVTNDGTVRAYNQAGADAPLKIVTYQSTTFSVPLSTWLRNFCYGMNIPEIGEKPRLTGDGKMIEGADNASIDRLNWLVPGTNQTKLGFYLEVLSKLTQSAETTATLHESFVPGSAQETYVSRGFLSPDAQQKMYGLMSGQAGFGEDFPYLSSPDYQRYIASQSEGMHLPVKPTDPMWQHQFLSWLQQGYRIGPKGDIMDAKGNAPDGYKAGFSLRRELHDRYLDVEGLKLRTAYAATLPQRVFPIRVQIKIGR